MFYYIVEVKSWRSYLASWYNLACLNIRILAFPSTWLGWSFYSFYLDNDRYLFHIIILIYLSCFMSVVTCFGSQNGSSTLILCRCEHLFWSKLAVQRFHGLYAIHLRSKHSDVTYLAIPQWIQKKAVVHKIGLEFLTKKRMALLVCSQCWYHLLWPRLLPAA